jgi:hypothetical protein
MRLYKQALAAVVLKMQCHVRRIQAGLRFAAMKKEKYEREKVDAIIRQTLNG